MSPIPYPQEDVVYPDTDGRPVAESDFQREPLLYAVAALRRWFRDRDDVYVSGNMLLYYEEGNPKAAVAPDVFVVIGAPKHDRRIYKLWEEPKAPDFVLEIGSRCTVSEDQGVKRGLYAFLGINEYWQYDPTGDYLKPMLTGLRLVDGNDLPLPVRTDPEGALIGDSEVLGLQLRLDQQGFHLSDPTSGTLLPTYAEAEQARLDAEQARQEAEARASAEEALRRQAEQRIAELEARLRSGG